MAIKGSLKEASLPDIMQMLFLGQKSGCLSVTDGHDFGNIYFENGLIIYAELINRKEHLGDILLKRGKITPEQKQIVIEKISEERGEMREGSLPLRIRSDVLGRALVTMGLLSERELKEYITPEIEETAYTMMRFCEGWFNFEPDLSLEKENVLVRLNTENIMLEGARRVDEWRVIEKKIPALSFIFDLVPEAWDKEQDIICTKEEYKILSLTNGARDVKEIIRISNLGEFATCKLLYGLLSSGLIRRVGESSSSALDKEEKTIMQHRDLGEAFFKIGMFEEALREYKEITRKDEESLDAYLYLGLISYLQKRYDEAIRYYGKAIELDPQNAKLHNNLGVVLERQNKYEQAAKEYRSATKLALQNAKAHNNLGRIYYKYNAYQLALREFESALGSDPKLVEAYFYLGLIYIKEREYDKALSTYRKAIELFPSEAKLHNNLGLILEKTGSYEEALREYEEALDLDPDSAKAHYNLGCLYYRKGLYDQAVHELEMAVKFDSNLSDAHFKLGNIYYKQMRASEATEEWEKALEIDPDNEALRNNLRIVRGG